MSISSTVGVSSTPATTNDAAPAIRSHSASVDSDSDNDSSRVSAPAKLLAQLTELKKSDPSKFAEVVGKLKASVTADAKTSTDPTEQARLSDLASKLDVAGKTGDLSGLAAPAPAASAPAKKASADPADHNRDGTVTSKERQAYEVTAASKHKATAGSARAYAKVAAEGDADKAKANMQKLAAIAQASH